MASSSKKGDDGLMTEINVTPLVDVVLVLLVLMMVTATAMAQKTIQVELPKARSGDADSSKKPLMVAVDESGALFVDTDRLDETVVHALELLRGEHIAKIAIVVRAEGTP